MPFICVKQTEYGPYAKKKTVLNNIKHYQILVCLHVHMYVPLQSTLT